MHALPVFFLFFLSGVSGLIYQVIWVRQFGHVFGNTVQSAALVTGIFMCGLGVGSYVVGRWTDARGHGPAAGVRWYGYAEVAIACLGIAIAFTLPQLSAISSSVSSYERSAHGWYYLSTGSWAFRYAIATFMLAPPCLLMGGTLTLLIRGLVATNIEAAAWRIGILYGLNTAGAAAGALATDFWLVPRIGIFDAQMFAVALNATAGLGALLLSRRTRDAPPQPVPVTDEPRGPTSPVRNAGAALAMLGFAAMGLEILWFRFLSQMLGSVRAVFSLLLCTLLIGMWLGSMSAGALERRFGRAALLLLGTQAALVIVTLATLGALDHQAAFHAHRAELAASGTGELERLWITLRPIALVVLAPGFLLGFAYPLANAHAQRAASSVGRRAGVLYLANTAGNVLGATVTGFVLLPSIGVDSSLLVLLGVVVASMVPVQLSAQRRGRRDAVFAGALLVLSACVGLFGANRPDALIAVSIPSDHDGTRRVLTVSEGINETVTVVDIPGVHKALFTNGHAMSANGTGAQRYMRAFAHIPLLLASDPKSVLVICFGVGNTLHAASLHPSVDTLHVADLSENVLRHAHHFEATNFGILGDPRVSVFVNDGRHHLLMQPHGRYDLITLEPPPITFAGVASLYSQEFYALAKSRLSPGGFVTQWLPGYQTDEATVLSLVRSFVNVFPNAVLLSGFDKELILIGSPSAFSFEPDTVAARLSMRPHVRHDLLRIHLGTRLELAGTFVAAPETLAQIAEPPVTDDLPLLEYRIPTAPTRLPTSLFGLDRFDVWCPSCAARMPLIDDYLGFLRRYYRTEDFLVTGGPRPANHLRIPHSLADYPYFERLLKGDVFEAVSMARTHLAADDREAAFAALIRGAYLSPGDIDVHLLLGQLFQDGGDAKRAIGILSRAVALDPKLARTRVALARALRLAGDAKNAAEEAKRATELDEDDADAHYELAAALAAHGKKADSNTALWRTLSIDPNHRRANGVFCKRHLKAERPDQAAPYCQKAGIVVE